MFAYYFESHFAFFSPFCLVCLLKLYAVFLVIINIALLIFFFLRSWYGVTMENLTGKSSWEFVRYCWMTLTWANLRLDGINFSRQLLCVILRHRRAYQEKTAIVKTTTKVSWNKLTKHAMFYTRYLGSKPSYPELTSSQSCCFRFKALCCPSAQETACTVAGYGLVQYGTFNMNWKLNNRAGKSSFRLFLKRFDLFSRSFQ